MIVWGVIIVSAGESSRSDACRFSAVLLAVVTRSSRDVVFVEIIVNRGEEDYIAVAIRMSEKIIP
jgi:hypothetical protein